MDVDKENEGLSGGHAIRQFGKDVLVAALKQQSRRFMRVFHISTKTFQQITDTIAHNNGHLSYANLSDL